MELVPAPLNMEVFAGIVQLYIVALLSKRTVYVCVELLQAVVIPLILAGVEGAVVSNTSGLHNGTLLPQIFTALTQTFPPEKVGPKFNAMLSVEEEPVTPVGKDQL